jgi:hypothetical protein
MQKFFLIVFFVIFATVANAQEDTKVQQLEARVQALEKYIEQFNANLDNFGKNLSDQVDMKIKAGTDKVVAINPVSKKFVRIETNAGMFLLAVNKFQRTEEGYRLELGVGNPNAAKYSGAKFKLSWGKNFDPNAANKKYDDWRKSLTNGEYAYNGELLPGQWSEITIDLTPAGSNQLEYIECEMEVESIQLQK